jgi:hypothetical protein
MSRDPIAGWQGSAEGWNQAQPQFIPKRTWTPSALAFGVTLIFWGIATTPIVSAVGLMAASIALIFWIGELVHDE